MMKTGKRGSKQNKIKINQLAMKSLKAFTNLLMPMMILYKQIFGEGEGEAYALASIISF